MNERHLRIGWHAAASVLACALWSCSDEGETSGFATGGAGSGASGSGASSTGGGSLSVGSGGGGGGPPCVPLGDDDDVDADGYTPNDGDCDDCDHDANPNAVEVTLADGSEPADEDCDGEIDEVDPDCDAAIAINEMDPLIVARAVDLCKLSTGSGDWGVVGAQWTMADGSAPPALPSFHLGHGVLPAFGPNVDVRRGASMLALSSGTARRPIDPGYEDVNAYDKLYQGQHPDGFPKESPACPGKVTGTPHDVTGIEITIRTPSNAYAFSFDFDFFTYEWPKFICSEYNDFFVALLDPVPPRQMDGNISFDSQGNPVSVNNSLLEVCGCPENPPDPCLAGGKTFECALGNSELVQTGFGFDTAGEDHGSTSWLQTKAPVPPDSVITIRWAVYDSGDGKLDTTTLVDNWQWITDPGESVGTIPIPK